DHTDTAPWRRTRGGSTVVSRTVEGSPPAVAPPSTTRSIASRKYASTADAVVGGSSPLGLALGAVTGARRARTRPSATGGGESRTPTVLVPAVTSSGTPGRARRTSVSAPGQWRTISARARAPTSPTASAIAI